MQKICIPALLKSYTLVFSIVYAIYYLWNYIATNGLILALVFTPILLLGYFVFDLFIVCPRCKKKLSINEKGIYRPPLLKCDKCKQNLMKCKMN